MHHSDELFDSGHPGFCSSQSTCLSRFQGPRDPRVRQPGGKEEETKEKEGQPGARGEAGGGGGAHGDQ